MTHLVHTLPDRTVQLDSQEYLYFSGTSYLGISRNDTFQQFLQDGFTRYGTNYSSSRISNVQLAIFDEAEHQLATDAGVEAALTFSSGFLAGQAVVRLLQREGAFLYAPRTHPALWIENQPSASEKCYTDWIDNLPMYLSQTSAIHLVLLVNSVDPLYAEKYNFDWIRHLPDNRRYTIVLDDSHGLGIIGTNGNGIRSQIQAPPYVEVIVVGSLGKALGLPGGVVLGNAHRIAQLRKSSFFTAGSPMPPAYLYAFLQAKPLYHSLQQRLLGNTIFFCQKTASVAGHFHFFDNYPVFYTRDTQLYSHLYSHHILISSFPYPSAHDAPITRVIINALHTHDDIGILAERIIEFCQRRDA